MQERESGSGLECNSSTPEAHASKRRKMSEKVVVTVKIEEKSKKQQRNDGPPYDCWSWRKYGQKPIKGSPYPRGYYRCSTSKGCSAKKQVERCKTDSTMLIITYTSTHNHPGPDSPQPTKQKQAQTEVGQPTEAQPTSPQQEAQFEYSQSPFNSTIDNPLEEDLGRAKVEIPEPFCGDSVGFSSMMKTEENDFYDELEELPTSSFFTAFMRSGFCEESVAVNLS